MILREDCYPIGAIVKLLKIFSQFIAIVPWQIHLATRTNHCPPQKKGPPAVLFSNNTMAGGR